jgi:hypothetical protein
MILLETAGEVGVDSLSSIDSDCQHDFRWQVGANEKEWS